MWEWEWEWEWDFESEGLSHNHFAFAYNNSVTYIDKPSSLQLIVRPYIHETGA